MSTASEPTCTAVRADGTPCTARARPSGFCWAHDPHLHEKRRIACRTGGQNKARGRRAQRLLPSQMRPVLALLIDGMDEVHRGTLKPARYFAMASGANAVCKLFELAELEERLLALEEHNARTG
jgi:hypothetical protein